VQARWRQKPYGLKRHVLVDDAGALAATRAALGHMQDRATPPSWLCNAKPIAPTIGHYSEDSTGQSFDMP
jgi:hypothetical protein